MTEQAAKKIVAHLTEQGEKATVYEGYSGRFMFGKQTTGVVARSASLIRDAAKELRIREKLSHDNLGLEMIVY